MSQPTINGEKMHSQTLDHFTSYPLVSDVLSIYSSHSLGKKSIELYNRAYGAFAEPLFPYLQTPYSYAKPYLQRADSFGNSSLDTVDTHFPAVTKTNIDGLRDYAVGTAQYPFKLAGEGKEYFLHTYNDEYKKSGGQGVVYKGKALVATELRMVADILHLVGDYLGPKRNEIQAKLDELKKAGLERVERTRKVADTKVEEVKANNNTRVSAH